MKIAYKTKEIEKICTDAAIARRVYGDGNARKIMQRLGEIQVSQNAQFMVKNRIGRCHPLKGERAGQFALDLSGPYRLIFREEKGVIIIAKIEEIVDYH